MWHCQQMALQPRLLLILAALNGWVGYASASTHDVYNGARPGHRIVQTRYGRLHGMILPLDNFRFLRSVEVFLGVPYATPPTKQNRYVPLNNSNRFITFRLYAYLLICIVVLAQRVRQRPGMGYESRTNTVQCARNDCPISKMKPPP